MFSIEIKNVDVNFLLLLITFSKPRMQKNIQNNKKSKCVAHLSAIHDFISKPPRQKDVIRECRRSLLEQLSRNEKDVGSLICGNEEI